MKATIMICTMWMMALSFSMAPSLAQTSNNPKIIRAFLPHATPADKSSPPVELIACKREGTPCKTSRECCSRACVKGMDEGRPGAWCGTDRN